VGEDDLVLHVHRVLCGEQPRGSEGGRGGGRTGRLSGLQHGGARRLQVHGADGAGGHVDVVHVAEDHGLIGAGQGDVLLPHGRQGFPPVPDGLLEQCGATEAKQSGRQEEAEAQASAAHPGGGSHHGNESGEGPIGPVLVHTGGTPSYRD